MHEWDEATDLLAHSVIGYAIERLKMSKDPTWGARPAEQLAAVLDGVIRPDGIGGHAALTLFRDVLMHACRPMDAPLHLAYVATAPTPAANMFDLVVSSSSIFGGMWESGAGAIAAENQTLQWLAGLAGFPDGAGGCFVAGGSAANLSALVTARHHARLERGDPPRRWCLAATDETHASVHAAARVMDVDVLVVPTDERGRMTGAALRATIAEAGTDGLFAVVGSFGSTNAGAVDELDAIADVCAEHGLWLHVDAAYGGAALCAPSAAPLRAGFERADSFGIDPHKWLFAPYDCAALVYRDPALASAAHAQHGTYLDMVSRDEWNPSDFAFHLSRRARGLPLWFSLATYGTDAYAEAVETTLDVARRFAAEVEIAEGFELLLDPQLSVVLFTVDGWDESQYAAWSSSRAKAGVALIVPTWWHGDVCYRVCLVNPLTTPEMLSSLLDDMASSSRDQTGRRGKSGSRRSRKDLTPSAKSGRVKLSVISSIARRSAAPRPACSSVYTCRFITAIDDGDDERASWRTYSCAAGSTSSAGSARLTRPMRAASSPRTRRAENSRSRACAGPTSRASSHDRPHSATSPRWANDVVSTVSVFMKRRSHASTIGTPIPATGPLMAAITGLGTDIM